MRSAADSDGFGPVEITSATSSDASAFPGHEARKRHDAVVRRRYGDVPPRRLVTHQNVLHFTIALRMQFPDLRVEFAAATAQGFEIGKQRLMPGISLGNLRFVLADLDACLLDAIGNDVVGGAFDTGKPAPRVVGHLPQAVLPIAECVEFARARRLRAPDRLHASLQRGDAIVELRVRRGRLPVARRFVEDRPWAAVGGQRQVACQPEQRLPLSHRGGRRHVHSRHEPFMTRNPDVERRHDFARHVPLEFDLLDTCKDNARADDGRRAVCDPAPRHIREARQFSSFPIQFRCSGCRAVCAAR